ncbi:hypothetical protein [Streptomyces fructofermentans]|uniref:Uncharacterized protein n=1 Tax=Streptomyces fructofermentans TaxID=152141 RepID=A0A918NKT4_9ACTN|nr:hypothetical protein [Streptomyces fructofermentans]GGX76476.1 hypothetical protein GCM10010515_50360 [Streptomyces fructofermentans]
MAYTSDDDLAFRNAVKDAFLKYPEAQRKYALSSLDLEERMGIDFDQQVGVSKIVGNKIITEFLDRKAVIRSQLCLKWNFDYSKCLQWEEAPE